jgi:carbonic anhydrase
MERLIKGFEQFRRTAFPEKRELFEKLASGQTPHTMFITCADSRVAPELFTSSEPGDIFVCRNVGNIVPPYAQFTGGVSAAIEYAVAALKVQNIVVCGHSDCGAMKATQDPSKVASLQAVSAWLRHSHIAKVVVDANYTFHDPAEHLAKITEENVVAQLDHLRTHPSVAAKLMAGQLQIHGWIFDIEAGSIKAYSSKLGRFVPLEDSLLESDDLGTLPHATPPSRLSGNGASAGDTL